MLANKALAATYNTHGADISIVIFQNLVAVILVESCRMLGVVEYAKFQPSIALRWLPVNVMFVAMLVTSFMSLKYLSVPMVTIFKNLANVTTATGEWYFFEASQSSLVVVSFVVMIVGAVLAGSADLSFSLPGYLWMSVNCFATSSYILLMKRATKTLSLSKFGMVFYNNLLSVPLLLPVALLKGELASLALLAAPSVDAQGIAIPATLFDAGFLSINVFAGAVGFFLNLASLWCVSATSGTTYAIVGAMNKIPTTLLGFFIFDTPMTAQGGLYILLSMSGGFIYSFAKISETRQSRT